MQDLFDKLMLQAAADTASLLKVVKDQEERARIRDETFTRQMQEHRRQNEADSPLSPNRVWRRSEDHKIDFCTC